MQFHPCLKNRNIYLPQSDAAVYSFGNTHLTIKKDIFIILQLLKRHCVVGLIFALVSPFFCHEMCFAYVRKKSLVLGVILVRPPVCFFTFVFIEFYIGSEKIKRALD